MTKQTLAEAIKNKAAAKADNTAATTAAGDTTSHSLESDTAASVGDDADADAPKSLADFQSAFGRQLGAVYFAEGTAFETATAIQAATAAVTEEFETKLTAANEEIATLKNQLAAASSQVLGEDEPITTGSQADSVDPKSANRVGPGAAAYAATLADKLKLNK